MAGAMDAGGGAYSKRIDGLRRRNVECVVAQMIGIAQQRGLCREVRKSRFR